MADKGRRTADERCCRNALDLNGIVCDKTVTALYKLYCGFALTDAGVTEKKNTLAVYLDENAVTGDTRTELNVKKSDQGGHKFRGTLKRAKQRHAVFFGHLDRAGVNLNRRGHYNARRHRAEEVLKPAHALLGLKLAEK